MDPSLIRSEVEELLRWDANVTSLMCVATEDTVVGGVDVNAGDRLVAWLPSANRDEEVFDRPNEVDITRRPNPHLRFGSGPHLCLGATLARLELRIAHEEFLSRYVDIEILGKVERLHANYVGGLKHFPLRLKKRVPEAAASYG